MFLFVFAKIFAAAEQRPCGEDGEADQDNERGHEGVRGDPRPGLDLTRLLHTSGLSSMLEISWPQFRRRAGHGES